MLEGMNDACKGLITVSLPETPEPGLHDHGTTTSDRCVDPRLSVGDQDAHNATAALVLKNEKAGP